VVSWVEISLTHHCYDWHPGSRCGWTYNQLTSKVDGGMTGSRLRWSLVNSHSVRPHNPTTVFRPASATVVSAEPFSHGTGTLRCLQKETATYRLFSSYTETCLFDQYTRHIERIRGVFATMRYINWLLHYITYYITDSDSVSLWRDPHDVLHCRIQSPGKTEWRLISATLCSCGWWRCFVAGQLWFVTRIREKEE